MTRSSVTPARVTNSVTHPPVAPYLEVAALDDAAAHAVDDGGEVDSVPLGALHRAPQTVDHLTEGAGQRSGVRGQRPKGQRSAEVRYMSDRGH